MGALKALLALAGEQAGFKSIIARTSPVPAIVQGLKEGVQAPLGLSMS
jgi:hypothetical protein